LIVKMETRLLERTTDESDNYTALAVFFDSESAPRAPAPKPLEDEEMNSRLLPGWVNTAVLSGLALIALLAAALGVWNWVSIRRVDQATKKGDQALAQLTNQEATLSDRVTALEKSSGDARKPDGSKSSSNATIQPVQATPSPAKTQANTVKKTNKGKSQNAQ